MSLISLSALSSCNAFSRAGQVPLGRFEASRRLEPPKDTWQPASRHQKLHRRHRCRKITWRQIRVQTGRREAKQSILCVKLAKWTTYRVNIPYIFYCNVIINLFFTKQRIKEKNWKSTYVKNDSLLSFKILTLDFNTL